jgi:hypothetical protein
MPPHVRHIVLSRITSGWANLRRSHRGTFDSALEGESTPLMMIGRVIDSQLWTADYMQAWKAWTVTLQLPELPAASQPDQWTREPCFHHQQFNVDCCCEETKRDGMADVTTGPSTRNSSKWLEKLFKWIE